MNYSTNLINASLRDTLAAVILTCCLILALTGCKATNSRSSTPTATQPVVTTPAAPVRDPRIQRLLEEAYFAFMESRLTTPIEDNAYYRYLQVLAIDPTNEDANTGISNIVEEYLDWSLESVANRNFRAATNYLNKARSVDDTHPNISAVETRITEYRNASEEHYSLDPLVLNSKTTETPQTLVAIAQRIQETAANVIISARSDAEGRWIYQQLNAQTDNRIKARFERRSKPGVRLVIP